MLHSTKNGSHALSARISEQTQSHGSAGDLSALQDLYNLDKSLSAWAAAASARPRNI
jgi:hypothetical protein